MGKTIDELIADDMTNRANDPLAYALMQDELDRAYSGFGPYTKLYLTRLRDRASKRDDPAAWREARRAASLLSRIMASGTVVDSHSVAYDVALDWLTT